MTNRPARPERMSWVSPQITVQDVDKSVDFYEKAFGFQKVDTFADKTGTTQYAEMQYNGESLMFSRENAFGNPAKTPATDGFISPVKLYLYCEDVDQFFQKALALLLRIFFVFLVCFHL